MSDFRVKWIQSRLPTPDDCNGDGDVYVPGGNLHHWTEFVEGDLWCPLPRDPETREETIELLLRSLDAYAAGIMNLDSVMALRIKL